MVRVDLFGKRSTTGSSTTRTNTVSFQARRLVGRWGGSGNNEGGTN